MKQTEYILAIGQHPSITDVRLVEKSKWPVKPCQDNCEEHPQYCFDTCVKSYEYDSDKLEALQQGAVVEYDHLPVSIQRQCGFNMGGLKCFDYSLKNGVYELDQNWVAEIKWQILVNEVWEPLEYDAYEKSPHDIKRRIAIIKPAQP